MNENVPNLSAILASFHNVPIEDIPEPEAFLFQQIMSLDRETALKYVDDISVLIGGYETITFLIRAGVEAWILNAPRRRE